MGFTKVTTRDLMQELEALDKERLALKERTAQKRAELNRRLREEHLDFWGVSEERYQAAKDLAKQSGRPLHECLNEARFAEAKERRHTQSATAGKANLGVEAKGT